MILYIVLLTLGAAVLSLTLSAIIVCSPDYKTYGRVYKTLPYKQFIHFKDQVWETPNEINGITWFLSENDFCLGGRHYLHNAGYTWFDPYSAYWLLKYRRWFKKNVKIT